MHERADLADKIIEKLVETVDQLVRMLSHLLKPPHRSVAASLASRPITNYETGNTLKHISTTFMAQTVTVLAGQNTVTQQLTPIAADGTTVEPITTINAGSEIYTVTPTGIATVAAVSGGPEGQYAVTRVSGQSGTVVVTYTAVNTAGTLITNTNGVGDTYNFQGATTGVAASLASALVSQN